MGGTDADVAIIGAGLSGLMAARRLQDDGQRVVLFDKGRRPGGRANTREHGARSFDHGAQYFTVRTPRIQEHLAGWLAQGVVAPWKGRMVRSTPGGVEPAKASHRYVAVPGMVDLALHLARGLDVRTGVRVGGAAATGGGWSLTGENGADLGLYGRLIVSVPAPQAAPLLESVPALRVQAAAVEMDPCWAVMVTFPDATGLSFDGAFVDESGLSWIARNSSKPDRPDAEAWVLHATPEWTRAHAGAPRDEVPALLLDLMAERFGALPPPDFTRAHRWGYAQPSSAAPGVLCDRSAGVAVCGDWTVGGRVEGALLSGLEAAEASASAG
jgi:predicted NAD/FAD-dependent oxidoreductase